MSHDTDTTLAVKHKPSRRRFWHGRSGSSASDRAVTIIVPLVSTILVGLPLGFLLYGSLRSGPPGSDADFTTEFWARAYLTDELHQPFFNSVMLGLAVATGSVILGAALAWIVARTDVPGRGKWPLVLAIPFVFSPLITTLAWIALAAPNAGFINVFGTKVLGLDGPIFNIYSFAGIALVMILHYSPLAFLAILAALRNVDGSMEEASRMLGAGALRTLAKMTLPLVLPAIVTSFLIVFVLAAENFSVPTLLGSTFGFETLPSKIYHLIEGAGHVSQAATTGTLLLWIALLGTMWHRRITRRAKRYVTVAGKSAPKAPIRLGKWKYAAFALCVLYVVLAIGLPLAALVAGSFMSFITSTITPKLFSVDNYLEAFSPAVLKTLGETVLLASITALVLTIFSILLSYVIQRRLPPRVAAFTDQVTMIPAATTGMVLAVGFLWAFLALPAGLYGTWPALGIAFTTIYIGYGVRMASSALSQISPDLEEAARVQGASAMRAFRDVTLPLLKPVTSSLWILLFVMMFLEVSAAILLYTPQTQTFSVLMWTSLATGSATLAFTLAVMQSVVIIVVLGIAQRLFGSMKHVTER